MRVVDHGETTARLAYRRHLQRHVDDVQRRLRQAGALDGQVVVEAAVVVVGALAGLHVREHEVHLVGVQRHLNRRLQVTQPSLGKMGDGHVSRHCNASSLKATSHVCAARTMQPTVAAHRRATAYCVLSDWTRLYIATNSCVVP